MAAQAAALHEGCEQPHGDLVFGFCLSPALLSAAQVHSVALYFTSKFWHFIFILTCFLSCHLLFLVALFPKSSSNASIVHTHNYQISSFLFTFVEIPGVLYLPASKYCTSWKL